jgi:hypothetical protein
LDLISRRQTGEKIPKYHKNISLFNLLFLLETIKQQPTEAAVFNNQVTANLFDLAPPDFSVELSGAVISAPKVLSIKEKFLSRVVF